MFVPTLTALATIFTLSQHMPAGLQLALQAEMPVAQDAPVTALPHPIEQPGPSTSDPEAVQTPVETRLPETAPPLTQVETENATPAPRPAITTLTEAERAQVLDRASEALSDARTAQGSFAQTNADGSVMTGAFALRRPGRVRFDYDAPTPILIVADGTTVAMEDSDLETVDRVPLSSTPLGLILDDQLAFSGDVDVLRVQQSDEAVSVTVRDATGEVEGELTMIFDRETYDLQGWLTVDGSLQVTTVSLEEVETNGRIDPRLFRLDEAEDEEDER